MCIKIYIWPGELSSQATGLVKYVTGAYIVYSYARSQLKKAQNQSAKLYMQQFM